MNRIDADVTPGLKTTLDDLRGTIGIVDRVLKNTDATLVGKDAPAQQELRDALQEITRAARSLRILTDYLEQSSRIADLGKERGVTRVEGRGRVSRVECRTGVSVNVGFGCRVSGVRFQLSNISRVIFVHRKILEI